MPTVGSSAEERQSYGAESDHHTLLNRVDRAALSNLLGCEILDRAVHHSPAGTWCEFVCTYTHVHTRSHVHICMLSHTQTTRAFHTCTNTHAHSVPTYMYMHTYAHVCAHAHCTVPFTRAHLHTCVDTQMCVLSCTFIHAHTCTHTPDLPWHLKGWGHGTNRNLCLFPSLLAWPLGPTSHGASLMWTPSPLTQAVATPQDGLSSGQPAWGDRLGGGLVWLWMWTRAHKREDQPQTQGPGWRRGAAVGCGPRLRRLLAHGGAWGRPGLGGPLSTGPRAGVPDDEAMLT